MLGGIVNNIMTFTSLTLQADAVTRAKHLYALELRMSQGY